MPYLDPGDLIMDGGNSLFIDTQRRCRELSEKNILFMGVGISGGELGALHGPSIMPGGDEKAYQRISPVLEAIAAKADGKPCVACMGPDGAGHFVKMTHNAIEYADMQIIAEAYDLMRHGWGLPMAEIQQVFVRFNKGALNSYLMEITTQILTRKDPDTGDFLLDRILDKAGHKGTGQWAVESALALSAFIPAITAALGARIVSGYLEARKQAAILPDKPTGRFEKPDETAIENLEQSLLLARIWAYAEGFDLMNKASAAYGWSLDFKEIARIWQNGCIIRSALLGPIQEAFSNRPDPAHLFLSPVFTENIQAGVPALRSLVAASAAGGMTAPVLSAALTGYDALRRPRLPANLIQAQRDCFGAHTYERMDKPGVFHTQWTTP